MIPRTLRAAAGRLRRSPGGAIGVLLIAGIAAAALARPLFWPHDPGAGDPALALAAPSLAHPLGTDAEGRDMAARILDGARLALAVPLGAVAFGIAFGTPLGLLAGMAGGIADRFLRRLQLALGFIPPLILALALVAAMGPSGRHMIIAIGVLETLVFARAMRDEVRAMHDSGFIQGARATGNALPRLILVHLLPNSFAAVASEIPRRAAGALGTLAVMGFVGVGVFPASTEWGALVRAGMEPMFGGQWWLAIFPGLALLVLGFALRLLAAAIDDTARRRTAAAPGPAAAMLAGTVGAR